jgi:hypothetical protein
MEHVFVGLKSGHFKKKMMILVTCEVSINKSEIKAIS